MKSCARSPNLWSVDVIGRRRGRRTTSICMICGRSVVQRVFTTSRRAEGLCDATACRETARCHVVQRDRATSRRAEGPRDVTWCRETAHSYGVQRDRGHYVVQRDCATLQRAEEPLDITSCRETAQR